MGIELSLLAIFMPVNNINSIYRIVLALMPVAYQEIVT